MFNIDEIKYLCSLDKGTFYLSPRSTYEFLIYGDIDHFEIMIESDLDDWIKDQKLLEYKYVEDSLEVIYFDEFFHLKVRSLKGQTIEEYLKTFDFNLHAVSIKISKEVEKNAFACFKESCYSSWVDPFNVKDSIKEGFIRPMHYKDLEKNGGKVFKMVHYMMTHHLDIEQEVIKEMKKLNYEVNASVSDYFFDLINQKKSYQYIKLLDEVGLIDATYPIVDAMKTVGTWSKGLRNLESFEMMMSDEVYFSDGVYRDIKRALVYRFSCGLNKYQLLKFSLLFKDAYQVMALKLNAPERYEDSFNSFCDYFGFDEETCQYYSQVIKSCGDLAIDMNKKRITLEEQYDFYDEFQDQTIEVLLIYYVQQIECENNKQIKDYVEYLVRGYINKYCELQSINNTITTMDIDRHALSDVSLTLLIEDVKKKIYYGNMRYDRKSIIRHLQKMIDEKSS
ncbi:hypothetical protein EZV73_07285 [Acidaminobacter sp. JC074]|uniref:hypothetical protein n=1 Tax=Acidaminobacter sp. JC074 TaxID=2530199 RepID=UPI001F0CE802|nr:hypothetical protein [Acidaminobacter sp. JC074]MCH4887368.1 hypothetical protein [Acidaminobacter sp. JC074]